MEDATALRTQLATNRETRQERLGELEDLQADLESLVTQLMADLEQLQRDEERFGEQLRQQREELRRQREAEERRKREAAAAEARAAQTQTQTAAPAPSSSGGLACPVGEPVAFADTWGAPRSGGRAHQGVDMMASHGTPVYAITAGRITRMTTSGLGGISLYMYGNDGNEYFYTHLQGYASGISSGMSVGAGTLIAYVGSTGNASSSAPHLHFEVHPGGGSAVNPYPYAARACGR
jgi:peptidoglycan LD-endopeptidase LytH